MRTPRTPLLLASLVVVALTACGGGGTATTTRTEAPPQDSSVDLAAEDTIADTVDDTTVDDTTEAPADDAVTLLDPGAEPRREMRLELAPGTESMTVVQQQSLAMSVAGSDQPLIESGSEMVTELDVSVVDEGYEVVATVVSAVAAEGTAPDFAATLDEALRPLVGVKTTTVIDNRGVQLAAELDDESLAGVSDSVASMMTQLTESSQLAAPLPVEPVGVGARWTVEQMITMNGLSISQLTEYRLTAVDGDVLTLEIVTTQRPLGTVIEMPGVPDPLEVLEWTSTATGAMTLDLTSSVPTSRIETIAHQVFGLGAQGELEQDMRMSFAVSPTPRD